MGEVYKARDTLLDRMVALKVSKTALNHCKICKLHDVITHASDPWNHAGSLRNARVHRGRRHG